MNDGPTNMFGDTVNVGDLVAITTKAWKRSRTRVAKVERIVKGEEIRNYDYNTKTYISTGTFNYRTFVRLYETEYAWLPKEQKRVVSGYRSYVKEVFGIGLSVPVSPNVVPTNVLKALRYEG